MNKRKDKMIVDRKDDGISFAQPIPLPDIPFDLASLLTGLHKSLIQFINNPDSMVDRGVEPDVIQHVLEEAEDLKYVIEECQELLTSDRTEEIAYLMFSIGSKFKEINLVPIGLSAFNNEQRMRKASLATYQSQKKSFKSDATSLKNDALRLLEDEPSLRIGLISELIAEKYGYGKQRIQKELVALNDNDPFLPENCFRLGRPKKN